MENNYYYKSIIAIEEGLEQRIRKCGEFSQFIKQDSAETIKGLDEYFDRCIALLNTRRAVLINEVLDKLKEQQIHLSQVQLDLQQSKESCHEILRAGQVVYASNQSSAETMWKEAFRLPCPVFVSNVVRVNFDAAISSMIPHFGTVVKNFEPQKPKRITALAGSTKGNENGKAELAKFSSPYGMCFNPHDNCLYVCDAGNNAIRKITREGMVSTMELTGEKLNNPRYIAMHYAEKTLVVVNSGNQTICKISSEGVVSRLAGNGTFGNATGKNASFNGLNGVAIHQKTGDIYVSDFFNDAIRKITWQGEVSTLVKSQESGIITYVAQLYRIVPNSRLYPCGMVFDEVDQCLYVCNAKPSASELTRVSLLGEISTVCKIGVPTSIAITEQQNILVFSQEDKAIYQIYKGINNFEMKKIAGSNLNDEELKFDFDKYCTLAFCDKLNVCFVSECTKDKIQVVHFE